MLFNVNSINFLNIFAAKTNHIEWIYMYDLNKQTDLPFLKQILESNNIIVDFHEIIYIQFKLFPQLQQEKKYC